jgi:hypothetical protein
MEINYGAQPQVTTIKMENGEIVTSLNVSDDVIERENESA